MAGTAELGGNAVLGEQPVQLGTFARLPLDRQQARKGIQNADGRKPLRRAASTSQ
jgi:hypothetical protein